MPTAIALIPTDLRQTRLGLLSLVDRPFPSPGSTRVLEQVVRRLCAVEQVRAVVLVHPADQNPLALLPRAGWAKPVTGFATETGLFDSHHAFRTAARMWALSSWRGGLGGATCYDELLPAPPLAAALAHHKADAAVLAGADWPLVDPRLTSEVLALHLGNAEAMQIAFCQAPPGLAGLAIGRTLLEQLATNPEATIGSMMAYHPTRAQADPIGRDVCVQVPGAVRSCPARLVYDAPRSVALLDAVAARLADRLADADAQTVTAAVAEIATAREDGLGSFSALPQQVTLELTPRRLLDGPVIPQHYVKLERQPMPPEVALRIVRQLGAPGSGPALGDVALTLGGLGDALLYPDWEKVVEAAHGVGVLGIAIETDLLVDAATLDRLVDAPIDLVCVRLNGDSVAGYTAANGADHYKRVLDNIGHLMNRRAKRQDRAGLPWIVPRFVKTAQALDEMETFFDRWMHFASHAVIDPATTGQGPGGPLLPVMSPVDMAPPKRRACRQIAQRMTIHSDGTVARCDQDWLGHGRIGAAASNGAANAAQHALADIWHSMATLRHAHAAGRWSEMGVCAACHEWHRP